MDVENVLAELRDERNALDAAIYDLENLVECRGLRSLSRTPRFPTSSPANKTKQRRRLSDPALGER